MVMPAYAGIQSSARVPSLNLALMPDDPPLTDPLPIITQETSQ
jgi:hypothetical protein